MEDVIVLNTKSLKFDVFLRAVAMHLTRTDRCIFSESEGVYYVGGGYWRLRPVFNPPDADAPDARPVGVALINPDRTREERAAVAKALAILVF